MALTTKAAAKSFPDKKKNITSSSDCKDTDTTSTYSKIFST